jgi:hypothetical protein
MSLLREMRREVFQMLGLEANDPPRLFVDGVLGAIGAFALIILVALTFEKHPWAEHRRTMIFSGTAFLLAIMLSKHRTIVFLSMLVAMGFRGLIAVLLYRYWPGLAFAALGALAFYLGAKWYANRAP